MSKREKQTALGVFYGLLGIYLLVKIDSSTAWISFVYLVLFLIYLIILSSPHKRGKKKVEAR